MRNCNCFFQPHSMDMFTCVYLCKYTSERDKLGVYWERMWPFLTKMANKYRIAVLCFFSSISVTFVLKVKKNLGETWGYETHFPPLMSQRGIPNNRDGPTFRFSKNLICLSFNFKFNKTIYLFCFLHIWEQFYYKHFPCILILFLFQLSTFLDCTGEVMVYCL